MSDLLSIYHSLPYPLRVLAATMRGYHLKYVRYTVQTNEMVEEILSRETWSKERWRDWQGEKLTETLWHAARTVPYYRQYWDLRRGKGDNASPEYLENWPLLTKDEVRKNPRAFISDSANMKYAIAEHTSGTTGKPLTLWMSKEAIRNWYALFEARWRGWYGVSRYDRWGILGGQLITPIIQQHPPYWVWNHGLNQLYLSSYHISVRTVNSYMDAIRSHSLRYLFGYASSLYSIAKIALANNLRTPKLKLVLSNAEPLYDHQREVISGAFDCPVYDTYGLSENVCAASECTKGELHLWPEAGVTEIYEDTEDVLAAEGFVGRLVCTGLLNSTMPLIRYIVGDRAAIAPTEAASMCGRSLPVLNKVEGRMDDVIVTSDGRRIGRLDPVFKSNSPIREAQIIQESVARIRVRYVPISGFGEKDASLLTDRLRDRVGNMEIILEEVSAIPRSANGKFRAVVSNLPLEENI